MNTKIKNVRNRRRLLEFKRIPIVTLRTVILITAVHIVCFSKTLNIAQCFHRMVWTSLMHSLHSGNRNPRNEFCSSCLFFFPRARWFPFYTLGTQVACLLDARCQRLKNLIIRYPPPPNDSYLSIQFFRLDAHLHKQMQWRARATSPPPPQLHATSYPISRFHWGVLH